ncbi:MAG: uroporphyrinogen decarboxylase family protein [Armatimonadota bacterium]|nr:uroporphyrinogen decarboxylase family protein [Armatimonadota bacterium]
MTHRERFFALMENRPVDRPPFFPDITDWYKARRTLPGEPQHYGTGQFIFDDDPFHKNQVDMPERFRDFTLFDFYREFDWGCPIHAYGSYTVEYEDVAVREEREGNRRHEFVETPVGTLHTIWGMGTFGSESVVRYPVQGPEDIPALEFYARHTHYHGEPEAVQRILDAVGDRGVLDIPIWRTPFGSLIQDYMGYEAVAYALADDPIIVNRLMDALADNFFERVEVAAELPGRIVIITDHADEYLISPRQLREYCAPYYREAQKRLHAAGKLVSTHLDGNFKAYLDLLPEAGFDLLDGCTPAPMGNYEPEDLASALGPWSKAYCGVPATLFCTNTPTEEILGYGRRIVDALSPNVILNVGDVLPPNGDIDQVIALGNAVKAWPWRKELA